MDNSCGLTGFFLTKAGRDRPVGHATAFTVTVKDDGGLAAFSYDYDGSATPLIVDGGEISRHCAAFIIKAPEMIVQDIADTFNHIAVVKRDARYRYGRDLTGFHDCDADQRLIGNCLTIPMKIFEECGLPHFNACFPGIFASPSPQECITAIDRLAERDFMPLAIERSDKTVLSRYGENGHGALLASQLSGVIALPDLVTCAAFDPVSYHQEGALEDVVPDFVTAPSCADQRHPAPLPR